MSHAFSTEVPQLLSCTRSTPSKDASTTRLRLSQSNPSGSRLRHTASGRCSVLQPTGTRSTQRFCDVGAPDGVVTDGPFTWANGKAKITSRFAVVDQDRELTWTGVSSGAKAVHRHVLHLLEDGATRLESEESMAGPFLTLFYSSAKLQQGMMTWLTAIKTAAEQS